MASYYRFLWSIPCIFPWALQEEILLLEFSLCTLFPRLPAKLMAAHPVDVEVNSKSFTLKWNSCIIPLQFFLLQTITLWHYIFSSWIAHGIVLGVLVPEFISALFHNEEESLPVQMRVFVSPIGRWVICVDFPLIHPTSPCLQYESYALPKAFQQHWQEASAIQLFSLVDIN